MFIEQPGVQLVDVRTPAEYSGGHIPGARLMDVYSPHFASDAASLLVAAPVAVYCAAGVRSAAAAQYLRTAGYEVEELSAGFAAWRGDVKMGMEP